jgi:signal transduction histidine kinase
MEHKAIQATLQERERMARELHDTLVQSSASVRMQAETASILLERGEDEQVSQILNQIADSAQQMHLDLRQYIFDIRTKLSSEQSFFDELQNYLTRFSQTWKIQTELQIPAELEQHGFRKGLVEAQIMGIIQEALINIHKHASAKRVCIKFKLNTSCLSLTIDDDGCGFNPILPVSYAGNHFGMRSMSERAQSLGGLFEIHSTPGQGTQVIVSIPYNQTELHEGINIENLTRG